MKNIDKYNTTNRKTLKSSHLAEQELLTLKEVINAM